MTPITLPRYQELSQANINEFLKGFFDGVTHSIGGNMYLFPDCERRFGRQQIPRALAKPWIVVESIPTSKPDKIWSGTNEMKIIRDSEWRFVVVTDNRNQDTAPNWRSNEVVSDLLVLILDRARTTLAAGGQKIIRVSQPKKEPVEDGYLFCVINVTIRVEMAHG